MTIRSMPSTPEYRENYDRIFRSGTQAKTEMLHAVEKMADVLFESKRAEEEEADRLRRALEAWGIADESEPQRRAR